jgi:mRNA-degrading endonuclease toxin of MazEF toxin-antitoxin module
LIATCEDIKSISTERLVRRLGTGSDEVVHRVRRVLDHLLEV